MKYKLIEMYVDSFDVTWLTFESLDDSLKFRKKAEEGFKYVIGYIFEFDN